MQETGPTRVREGHGCRLGGSRGREGESTGGRGRGRWGRGEGLGRRVGLGGGERVGGTS